MENPKPSGLRPPLVNRNTNSKLPQISKLKPPSGISKIAAPVSKLAVPTSKAPVASKPPASVKRKASPDTVPVQPKAKKTCNGPAPRNNISATRPSTRNTSVTKNTAPVKKGPGMARSLSSSSVGGKSAKPAPATKSTTGSGTAPGGKKRAAWDVKGRLEDMEKLYAKNMARLQNLESNKEQLESHVAKKETQTAEASRTISELQSQMRSKEEELANRCSSLELQLEQVQSELLSCKTERDQLKSDLETERERVQSLKKTKETLETKNAELTDELTDLRQKHYTLTKEHKTLETDHDCAIEEIRGFKMTIAKLTSENHCLDAQLSSTKGVLEETQRCSKDKTETIIKLEADLEDRNNKITDMTAEIHEHETTRRKLHNTIQELKGNIRVFCRVRPLLGEETLGNDGYISHINFPGVEQTSIELDKLAEVSMSESVVNARRGGTNKYEFQFDKVFQPESTQATVFEEISQLVQSALDGYHVCIFAYGQTGSGKTYTMEGNVDSNDQTGMIPRSIEQVFQCAKSLSEKGWEYNFHASFLEIYNESIRDLLSKEQKKHEIKMVSANSQEIYVSNLTIEEVNSEYKVLDLLRRATNNRAVAETKCNERSSRSHSVFQLRIQGKNTQTGEDCSGLLNLIDLAGSERLKDSESKGQRLQETKAINSSLSSLGNVIMALANKEQHIPYRNSKLTHLLHNSLGGSSKVLMFVNVSPKEECFNETLNSLRFATKVNNCQIGTATKKIKL